MCPLSGIHEALLRYFTKGDGSETLLKYAEFVSLADRTSSQYRHFRCLIQRHWSLYYRAMCRMRQERRAGLVTEAVKKWMRVRNMLELKETDDYDPFDEGYPWYLVRPCNWNQCLCGKIPADHRMKACKGCFRAFYCSTFCQTK